MWLLQQVYAVAEPWKLTPRLGSLHLPKLQPWLGTPAREQVTDKHATFADLHTMAEPKRNHASVSAPPPSHASPYTPMQPPGTICLMQRHDLLTTQRQDVLLHPVTAAVPLLHCHLAITQPPQCRAAAAPTKVPAAAAAHGATAAAQTPKQRVRYLVHRHPHKPRKALAGAAANGAAAASTPDYVLLLPGTDASPSQASPCVPSCHLKRLPNAEPLLLPGRHRLALLSSAAAPAGHLQHAARHAHDAICGEEGDGLL
jgi:hypothetical protein